MYMSMRYTPSNQFQTGSAATGLVLALLVGCGPSAHETEPELYEATKRGPESFADWKLKHSIRGIPETYAAGGPVSPVALVGEAEARAGYEATMDTNSALVVQTAQTEVGIPTDELSTFGPKATIRYCIDVAGFNALAAWHQEIPSGTNIALAVDFAFGAAAAAWNSASGTWITKVNGREDSCFPTANDNIDWYVTPTFQDPPIQYFTFALRPHQNKLGPEYRAFLIWEHVATCFAAYGDDCYYADAFTFEGLMLRAIGAGLGFLPEEIRGGTDTNLWPIECKDDSVGARFVSYADPYSVMSHPSAMTGFGANSACVGYRDKDYAITYTDAMAASCLYRGDNPFYYCVGAKTAFNESFGPVSLSPDCSPVPMVAGGAGDCGAVFDFTSNAANIEAAMHVAID